MTILLPGTAVTRKDAAGPLDRWSDAGAGEPAEGIPLNTGVQGFAAHPMMPGVVFAAARSGVYRSTDSGASWHKLAVPSHNEEFWSVSVHPTRPDVIYAGAAPVGVYRSEDCGESWRRVGSGQGMRELCDMTGATGFSISRLMRLCFDPTNPASMYGACETNGMIVSDDGGQAWRGAIQGLIEITDNNEKLRSKDTRQNDCAGI